jgi:hypothetical protein
LTSNVLDMSGEARVLLLPQITVTSKLADREWPVRYGTFSWIGWRSRGRPSHTYGEIDSSGAIHDHVPGRLIFKPRGDADDEEVALTLDALTSLMGLAAPIWGEEFSPIPIPTALLTSENLLVEELEEAIAAEDPEFTARGQLRSTSYVGDDAPEWALDRIDVALSGLADLIPALAYIFESRREFLFLGDDITMVQADPKAVPPSPIQVIRMETSFHNAYKAMEALLGGEPPTDRERLRERLESRSIDPDEVAGFAGMREDMLTRVARLQMIRDKRSAHGGRTGVKSKAITYFELMDAQYAVTAAISARIDALKGVQAS